MSMPNQGIPFLQGGGDVNSRPCSVRTFLIGLLDWLRHRLSMSWKEALAASAEGNPGGGFPHVLQSFMLALVAICLLAFALAMVPLNPRGAIAQWTGQGTLYGVSGLLLFLGASSLFLLVIRLAGRIREFCAQMCARGHRVLQTREHLTSQDP